MAIDLIALEEHFTGQAVAKRPSAADHPQYMLPQAIREKLEDLGEGRFREMELGNVSVQVVSHIPVVEPPEICAAVNDQLFKAVKASKGRLRAFGLLPMAHPEAITAELERCVKSLGFLGAVIINHANGRYYDDPAYWPMWEKAQELDVPITLHPTTAADMVAHKGNYDHQVQTLLAGPALRWHVDTAAHVLRLYGSGLFDAFPRLKLILGHDGETLPFSMDRIASVFAHRWGGNKRDFRTVWNENCWITNSGMFEMAPFECCLKVCKPDRIMYSKSTVDSFLVLFPPACRLFTGVCLSNAELTMTFW